MADAAPIGGTETPLGDLPLVAGDGPERAAAPRGSRVPPYLAVLAERPAVGLLTENAEGVETIGLEVTLRACHIAITASDALAHRHGGFLRAQAVRSQDCVEFVRSLKLRYASSATPAGAAALGPSPGPAAEAPTDDIRTLWVDYNEVGERFKSWRKAVQESREEPITAVDRRRR